jgi:galactose mutarotase-like enzyme
MATIEETTRDGYPALTLADGDLTATFAPQLGMIGASLEHRGEELLGQRNGLPAYEARGSTMGIPLLHPWANRLSSLQYEVAGRHVTIDPDSPLVRLDPNGLPIHGLLAANPGWHVKRTPSGGLSATLDFGAQPELLEVFPFPHTLSLDIDLDPGGLTVGTTLSASEGSAVPVSFGFHPYFDLPGAPREDWHVKLPVDEHLPADERGIPTGSTEPADPQDGPLGDRSFDDGYCRLADPRTFVLAGAGRRIELTLERGYDFAQVYAPPDQRLICFEPMTAATNALVAGGPGLRILEPGEQHVASFRIAVSAS